mmetsp:Transcript_48413/g.128205  ORF Transcript_48413/g.128205 Transcript_48413/m.128205 type:complete len:230 (-) Transcript_48413:257-946(-)
MGGSSSAHWHACVGGCWRWLCTSLLVASPPTFTVSVGFHLLLPRAQLVAVGFCLRGVMSRIVVFRDDRAGTGPTSGFSAVRPRCQLPGPLECRLETDHDDGGTQGQRVSVLGHRFGCNPDSCIGSTLLCVQLALPPEVCCAPMLVGLFAEGFQPHAVHRRPVCVRRLRCRLTRSRPRAAFVGGLLCLRCWFIGDIVRFARWTHLLWALLAALLSTSRASHQKRLESQST